MTLSKHRELLPKKEQYVGPRTNFQPTNMICLNGTIRVTYKSAMYHIPIAIYLPATFPSQEPECYIKPTNTMEIRRTKNVDAEGKVYAPVIADWRKTRGASLDQVLAHLQAAFGEAPPVVAKRQQQPVGPPSSVYRPPNLVNSQSVNSTPYPVGGPGYPMPMPYGQNAYPGGYPNPQANTNPYGSPMQHLPSYTESVRPNRPPPPQMQSQSSIDPDIIKNSQIERINNILIAQSGQIETTTNNDIQTLSATQEKLREGEKNLNQQFIDMRNEKMDLETKIQQLESVLIEKQAEVAKMEEYSNSEINPDEIIQANTPLERQILKCHSEDLAISDALYYLNSALQKDQIDVDQFLREVRKMGRKQFQLRATLKKARLVGGLAPL